MSTTISTIRGYPWNITTTNTTTTPYPYGYPYGYTNTTHNLKPKKEEPKKQIKIPNERPHETLLKALQKLGMC